MKNKLEIKQSRYISSLFCGDIEICRLTAGTRQSNEAYAKRIIKSYNMHDELLEVVKNTDKDMNGLATQKRLNPNGIKYHTYIKELIKKAELKS